MLRLIREDVRTLVWSGRAQGWRGVLVPAAAGVIWTGVCAVLIVAQQRAGFPAWISVSLGVVSLAGLFMLAVALTNLMLVTRLDTDPETHAGAWELRWRLGFTWRRVEYTAEQVHRVSVSKATTVSSHGSHAAPETLWTATLHLHDPQRALLLAESANEQRVLELAEAIAGALGVETGPRPRPKRDGPLPILEHIPLRPRQQAVLDATLEDGEQVVWTGRPHAWAMASRAGALPTALFGLIWTGIVAGALVGPGLVTGRAFSPAFGPIIAVVLGLLFGWPGLAFLTSPVWAWVIARRTAYALTDRRPIVLEGRLLGPPRPKPYGLGRLRVEERPDGLGHLLFTDDEGFLGVDRPRDLEQVVRSINAR